MSKKENMQFKKAAQRVMGPTHKKKDTYILKLDNLLCDLSLFGGCKMMPMPVIAKNKKESDENKNSGWMSCHEFPNPCAYNMVVQYSALAPYMTEKLARTVVIYKDKENDKPVLMLFPTEAYVMPHINDDYEKHLNHASRRDLERQINMRKALIEKYLEASKQK